ncbi:hypothetical protein BD309DRAFT_930689 [Dichomitus squalens]|nr:hypothetical protein BD309DRAFT_930689 [Dichomitus squalens]
MSDVALSPSARVLTDPHLLYATFTFVPLDTDFQDRHLAPCATVCRAFHQPVVRVLWRSLYSMLPLWHLLAPHEIKVPRHIDVFGCAQYLIHVILAQLYLDSTRWERFLWHANHVRNLHHGSGSSPQVNQAHSILIEAVLARNGGKTFLPLLSSLHWTSRIHTDGSLLPFLTSTVQCVLFSPMNGQFPEDALTIRKLRESSPDLRELNIDGEPTPSLVREVLAGFDGLRDVSISLCADFSVFRALVTKPNLRSLRIVNAIGPWAGVSQPITVHDLRKLSVGGHAEADLASLFRLTRFQSLEALTVQIYAHTAIPTTMAGIIALFYDLSGAVSASDLQTLTISGTFSSLGPPPDHLPFLRDLLPRILRLSTIRSFRFSSDNPLARLDGADIEALARAWPRLTHLHLDAGAFDRTSTVPVDGLSHLYSHCPDLQEVSLPVLSVPGIGAQSFPTPPGRSSHRLGSLSTQGIFTSRGGISDEEVEALARYLLRLFPRLNPETHQKALEQTDGAVPEGSPDALRIDPAWLKVTEYVYSIRSKGDEYPPHSM